MTVKENQKEIDALAKKVADLTAKLEAKGGTDDLAKKVAELEGRLSERASAKKGFIVTKAPSITEARDEIEAKRGGKPKTYLALSAGTDYRQGFIPAGTTFTTDMPKGEWMEEGGGKPMPVERQFAIGPDLNARLRDMVDDGDIADEHKRPIQAENVDARTEA
jgi:hypothetical protein